MSISVKLCHNSSPYEKIGKTLDAGSSFDCLLKADTSVLRPTIIVDSDSASIKGYNYMYIADFGRYYFIDDIVSKNNNIWEISGHVDVLETYKSGILTNNAIIKRQQNKYNTYLNDADWNTYAYDDVITFAFSQSGFSKSLEYLLLVAGG